MNNKKIRVLIADDHSLFRRGLMELLKKSIAVKIIAEAANSAELKEKYFKYRPQVMLVDISMPDMSGIDAVSDIRKAHKNAKALFLSMYTAKEYIYGVYKAGGKGLISKNADVDELVEAIIAVYKGELYFGKNHNTDTLEKLAELYQEKQSETKKSSPECREYNLTTTEYRVLKLIRNDYSNKQIADEMLISEKTVETHKANIKRKNGLSTLLQLINFAVDVTQFHKEFDELE